MAESKLSRTTVSMEAELYAQASERMKKLGYTSFSEYIQFLLESDLHERPSHVLVREEDAGASHMKQPKGTTYLKPRKGK